MKILSLFLLICCLSTACQGQNGQERKTASGQLVGGPCEGCEAIWEFGERRLLPVDTLPDFKDSSSQGQRLLLTGTIYQRDGKTPAPDVVLYIYHTDQQGRYPTRGDEKGWARRHGYLRGWVKTGPDGRYAFYTLRPGSYPERTDPAHIHATIKEPGINEYYIDDYVFADDPLLEKSAAESSPRGGSGVLDLRKEGALWRAERDIILGLNVPGYEE